MMQIATFKEGQTIKGTYLVNLVTKGKTNNKNDYLSIKLQDKTGEIDAKLWNVTKEQFEGIVKGTFIYVEANVISYRDSLQLKLDVANLVSSENINIDDFVKTAPIAKEDLRNQLQQYIYQIDDRIINMVVASLVKKYESKLLDYPAASRNHHAYGSGLIYHIVSMLKLAESIALLYPNLNKNYLYAGVILHDIGKVEELSGPVATEYTSKGRLLGHISILVSQLEVIAKELGVNDSEQVMLLQHIILSHHGKYEYGSPVLPMLMEAEILTFIDNIDARMSTLEQLLENVEPGSFSVRSMALESRSFYKPKNSVEKKDD